MKKNGLFLPMAATIAIASVMAAGLIFVDRFAMRPKPPPASGAPRRIICMAPNIAETVFALGAGDRVVGVSSYTLYPPEAAERPDVGGLYNPNLERIAALDPDLIVVQHKHDRIEELARRRGIRALAVDMEGGVRPVLNAIRLLGSELDAAERAEALCAEIERSLEAVRRRTTGLPAPTAIVCVGRSADSLTGIYCAGKRSVFTDLLEAAGGRNLFADRDTPYFLAGVEEIVRCAPEVVIETRPGEAADEERIRELEKEWAVLTTLPAVKNGRVHVLTDPFIAVPGPRISLTAERLAQILHPETADGR